MAKTINEFRVKLIQKIRDAQSPEQAHRFIRTAMRTLAEKKVHGHIIMRFLDRLLLDIERVEVPANNNDAGIVLTSAITYIHGIRTRSFWE